MHATCFESPGRGSSDRPSDLPSRPSSHIPNSSSSRYFSLSVNLRVLVAVSSLVLLLPDVAGCEIAIAADTPRYQPATRYTEFIREAAQRFVISERWIRAVIKIESGGERRATSPRGALGLMQLMPGTWVELSARYGLGLDPFDARDNILAGTAYLKEMHDRFGSAGFLAAYHAGPRRYEQHLVTGKLLPSETTAYVAAVTPLLDNEQGEHAATDGRRALPWRESPLFVERAGAP